jgi:2-oxoglutarate dehydrogenase E2 component (dihydrolipoamide succinyltransferase)
MATQIVIPQLGESISEGVISAWLKAEGEYADRDEPVLELETDKITMEVPAPAAGAVSHTASEGDTVEVGAVVGSMDESAAKPAAAAAAPAPATQQTTAESAATTTAPPPPVAKTTPAPSTNGTSNVHATPLAKKIAQDHGIDLSTIAGTGASGRIREHDVLAAISSDKPAPAPSKTITPAPAPAPQPGSRNIHVEKMSPLRQRIAARLVEAQQTAAMLTTFNECDMTNLMAVRSRLKDQFLDKHDVKLGFMSFFVKAACSALQAVSNVNASIVEQEGTPSVKYHDYCDIAIAVGTKKGLVVPVLRNAESLSFAGVEQGILALATKARDGKLTLEDMQGGTFTISNGGVYGSMMSTPILNPPQSGILGMHNIVRRPVENPDKPGSGDVSVRPMMYLALSYDHRVVDGQGAVTFLKHVKECIEDPDRLLLGV